MYYFMVVFAGVWFIREVLKYSQNDNTRFRLRSSEYDISLHRVYINRLIDDSDLSLKDLVENDPEVKKIMNHYWKIESAKE